VTDSQPSNSVANKSDIAVNRILLIIVYITGIVGISFSAIFVRWTEAPVSVVASHRMWISVLILLPFAMKFVPEWFKLPAREVIKLIISGLCLGLHFLFWMASLRLTSVASSTAILTLEPVIVMLGAFLVYKQKASSGAIIAMLIAMVGAIMIGWGDVRFSGDALLGDLLSFIGAAVVAVHMLIGTSLRNYLSALSYSVAVFLVAAIVLSAYNVASGIEQFDYAANDWLMFALLAIVPTIFGHLLFNWLLKYMQTTTVSMAVLGEPLGATLLAYYLLGENVTWIQLAAGGLLIFGVWLFIRRQGIRKK